MSNCQYCEATMELDPHKMEFYCPYGCDEECACGLDAGECGPEPCEAELQSEAKIRQLIVEYGIKRMQEQMAERLAREMAVGG